MVDLTISGGNLLLNVRGADKLWAFKSSLEIPLQHVAGIRADPDIARGWWHGFRIPGTNLPGGDNGWHVLPGREARFLGCSQSRQHGRD